MADEQNEAPVAAPSAPAGEPSATPNPSPSPNPAPAPSANSGWEAKEKAFIADLQKERKRAQTFEAQVNSHKAELEQERRRVQALAGVNPRSAQDTEIDEVKERFKQLFPHLADLTAEDVQALRESRQQASNLTETTNHYWRTHSDTMVASVASAVAAELGGDELSPRQARLLRTAYTQAAQDDPEFLQRHTRGDKTLVDQFAKEFIEDWLKPAQRKAQAAELGRNRPVPSGRDRSIGLHNGKKIDVTNDQQVGEMLAESFIRRGGSFDR